MKLYELTTFQLEVLSLADSGATADISEVVQGLHTDQPLGWLAGRFGREFGRGFGPDRGATVRDLGDALTRHANVLSRDDLGVANNGLLFLAGVINSIIQAEGEWTR